MKIVNLKKAEERKRMKRNAEVDGLKKSYQELVRFYTDWYNDHVVGQDENGNWIYKNVQNHLQKIKP